MTFALIAFFVSLGLVIGLFSLKYAEARSGGRFAEPLRTRADRGAIALKHLLDRALVELEQLPPKVLQLTLRGAVALALFAASLARELEHQAHRFADFVASKRGFQHRESKNEFLKQVKGYKGETVEETENL